MTTKRHPRSLLEAWPSHYAGSLSGPFKRPLGERIADAAMAVVIGIICAAALFHWWSA